MKPSLVLAVALMALVVGISGAAWAVPAAPKIVEPSGTYIGAKPTIVFSGRAHSAFSVKVSKDAAGADTVWESGCIPSPGFSRPCEVALADGPYYASARVMTRDGWGAWSKGCAFTVDRSRESLDIRHMDEPDLLTAVAAAPDDMFGFKLDQLCLEHAIKSYTVQSSYLGATNTMWRVEDNGHGFPTAILRRHAVSSLDLDKGVTVVAAVRVQAHQCFGANPDQVVPMWMRGQIMIADADAAEPVGAAFRVMKDADFEGKPMAYNGYENVVGACADNRTWQQVGLGTESDDFLVIRITGRNQAAGDYTTTKWQLYVNESPTPLIIATGSIPRSVMDPKSNWMTTDCILLGQGFASVEANWDYDWLAVNMGGDYAPGEWDAATDAYVPGGGTRSWNGPYTTIAELRTADETAFARLSRPMVVSRVAKELDGTQTCFYVQDDTGGIKVVSRSVYPREVGREITRLSGVVPWLVSLSRVSENVKSVVYYPAPQPELIPNEVKMTPNKPGVKPWETTLNDIIGSGPVRSLAEVSPENLGKLVSVRGTLPLREIDPATAYWVYYLDDGTCPAAVDGRGGADVRGIRVARRRDDNDPGSHVRPWAGEFKWTIEGILTYEPNGLGSYVRTLAVPSFVMR